MQTKAIVIAKDGLFATVETERMSACEGCHKAADGGCSVCTLMGGDRKLAAKAYNPLNASVGDTVVIESRTGRILWYAALVFLFPLIFGFLFWWIAACLTDVSGIRILSGFCGFILCFVGVFCYSKHLNGYDVEITEIVKVNACKEVSMIDRTTNDHPEGSNERH